MSRLNSDGAGYTYSRYSLIKNRIIKNWGVIEIVKYKFSIDTMYLYLMNTDVT